MCYLYSELFYFVAHQTYTRLKVVCPLCLVYTALWAAYQKGHSSEGCLSFSAFVFAAQLRHIKDDGISAQYWYIATHQTYTRIVCTVCPIFTALSSVYQAQQWAVFLIYLTASLGIHSRGLLLHSSRESQHWGPLTCSTWKLLFCWPVDPGIGDCWSRTHEWYPLEAIVYNFSCVLQSQVGSHRCGSPKLICPFWLRFCYAARILIMELLS